MSNQNQIATNKNQVAVKQKSIADQVQNKVREFQERGELHFPANYSPDNAVKSAWLILQNTKTSKESGYKPALEHCTKDSIANSLLDMVVQGLNPMKKQGYFIVYGNQLVFQRSYFGTMAVTKRVTGASNIDAAVIYEGDQVTYEMKNGRVINLEHKQSFGNINKDKIIGTYCVIELPNDEVYTEVMTIEELRKAWSKAQFWGKGQEKEKEGSTHDEFKQEMAKKTVINRACKKFLNSSDDSSLIMQHFNGSDERHEEAQLQEEINENANSEVIDIEYEVNPEEPKQIENKPTEQIDINQTKQQQMDFVPMGTEGPVW